MEKMWNYCFYNELRIDPEESTCLMTNYSAENINKQNKEKILELMFETFQVRGYAIVP